MAEEVLGKISEETRKVLVIAMASEITANAIIDTIEEAIFVEEDPEFGAEGILKDGSVAMAADFNAGGNNLINVADPTSDQHAATKGWVEAQGFLTSITELDPLALKKDGSDAMSGNLDLAENDIVNTANVLFESSVTTGGVGVGLTSLNTFAFKGTGGGADINTYVFESVAADSSQGICLRVSPENAAGEFAFLDLKYLASPAKRYEISGFATGSAVTGDIAIDYRDALRTEYRHDAGNTYTPDAGSLQLMAKADNKFYSKNSSATELALATESFVTSQGFLTSEIDPLSLAVDGSNFMAADLNFSYSASVDRNVIVSNDTVNDATTAKAFEFFAASKTAGTGDGGELNLWAGSSAGGTAGDVNVIARKFTYFDRDNFQQVSISSPKFGAIYIGRLSSLPNITGNGLIAIGRDAANGTSVNLGNSVVIGNEAARNMSNSSTDDVIAIGFRAGQNHTNAILDPIMIGKDCVRDAGQSQQLTAIGAFAGRNLGTVRVADEVTIMGYLCADSATSMTHTVAIGFEAARFMSGVNVDESVIIGNKAGKDATAWTQGVAIGFKACSSLTSGGPDGGPFVTGVGRAALNDATSLQFDVALGNNAGASMTISQDGVYIGTSTGRATNNNVAATLVGALCGFDSLGEGDNPNRTEYKHTILIGANANNVHNQTITACIGLGSADTGNITKGLRFAGTSNEWAIGSEQAHIAIAYFGAGGRSAIVVPDFTMGTSLTTGTNIVGPDFTIAANGGTGNALPGSLKLASAVVGVSGTSDQAISTLIELNDGGLGFFGATPTTKPIVTGSRGGNAAVASALTGLAALGLIVDNSSA